MAAAWLKLLATASKRFSQTTASTPGGPSVVHMRNMRSHSKSKYIHLPAKIDFKQGAGIWVPYGTAYHALYHSGGSARCANPYLCTAQVAVWGISRLLKSLVRWV